MNKILKRIIIIAIVALISIGVTLPFAIVYKRLELVEIILVLVGCIELLAVNIRATRRERTNLKKYERRESKATDEGYEKYNDIKYTLIFSGIINLLISFIWFLVTK